MTGRHDARRRGALARTLPVLAVAAALALVASQAFAWLGIRRAVRAANEAEAEALFDILREELHEGGRAEDVLRAFVESTPQVRFASLVLPHTTVQAGNSTVRERPRIRGVVEGPGRVRAHWQPPDSAQRPRHPGPRHPEPRHPGPPGHRGPPPPHGARGLHAIEFEPALAPVLRRDALLSLFASTTGALFCILLAVALRRSVRAREEAARRAERDRRLATLGEMSAVLAHEIRNPLASLKGHAQLALEEDTPDKRKLERIVAEAWRLEELTDHLLDFVRTGALQRTQVDLRELVHELCGDDISVEGSAQVEGDRPRLRQAIDNLVTNARSAGGPVSVHLFAEGGEARIEVRDRGPGVPDDVEALFEPFHTTRVSGTGLGLAIVRRIAEAHGGRVDARPREGGGACFILHLPERRS